MKKKKPELTWIALLTKIANLRKGNKKGAGWHCPKGCRSN